MESKIYVVLLLMPIILLGCKKDIDPPVVRIITAEVSGITVESAICGGNVSCGGDLSATKRGVCWSKIMNPTLDNCLGKTEDGSGTGSFTSNITSLEIETTYYVCAYATNEKGTSYGEQQAFTTLLESLPIVTTAEVTDIKSSTATCWGNVTSAGGLTITRRGVCWSKNINPTIDNCLGKTEDGIGIGAFTSKITSLEEKTTYYVCAYAVNSKGVGYGSIKQFTIIDKYFTINGVSFKMIGVAGGTFNMGSISEYDEQPIHSVTLSNYYIGETEVTQELWQAVTDSNPSYFTGNLQRPVEQVSWNDCQSFISALNQLTGEQFCLPTEAQWEFAARGGNESQGYEYSGSNKIDDVAWFEGNSSSTTYAVKTKAANELGIYDMSGNVNEWCQDWYGSYSGDSQTNLTGDSSGTHRVLRGGNWIDDAKYCRAANRSYGSPEYQSIFYGFRIALLH